jgi:hypothetical protein
MKQVPDVVLSASALNVPPTRVRLGILGPCGLAPERRDARKRLQSNRWARRMEILRGASVTERLFDEPVK